MLHDQSDKIILVVCYTNHALDQFIEDLLNIGIPKSNIVRLGGKASAQTENLTVRKQARIHRFGRSDHNEINFLKSNLQGLSSGLHSAFDGYRRFNPYRHTMSIMDHIEITHPEYFYAFQVPTEDDEVVVGKDGKSIGPTYLLDRWIYGQDAGIFKEEDHVKETKNIWSVDKESRKGVTASWIEEMVNDIVDLFCEQANQHTDTLRRIGLKFSENDRAIIRSKRIIACTTTGAAKYRDDIAAAKPGILVVEEAGEILESHVLTALSADVEQIILIGDHKSVTQPFFTISARLSDL